MVKGFNCSCARAEPRSGNKGIDNEDIQRVFDLTENSAYHAEYEFDDLISELDNGETTDLKNNAIIKELLKVAKSINLSLKVK